MSFESFSELITGEYQGHSKRYLVPFRCNGCGGGLFIEVKYNWGPTPHNLLGMFDSDPQSYEILRAYPEPVKLEAPEYVPNNVSSFYLQAQIALRHGSFDASSMMSRKALEVAVKTIDPGGKGNLYQRIEKLREDGLITDSLKDWAHVIREDGNKAAHEIEPVTEDHAQELIDFCELFLMYTFTMPKMIEVKQGK